MRSRLLPFLGLLVVTQAKSEIVTLTLKSNTSQVSAEFVALEAGDVAEIISVNATGDSNMRVANIERNGSSFRPAFLVGETFRPLPFVVTGPAVIRAATGNNVDSHAMLTVRVSRANEAPAQTPSGAVVIPEDASGTYSVILESSTDMVTWAAANPGTYGGSETRRFFRTRIVKQ